MINNCPAKDELKPALTDVAALPPAETIREQAHTVQHAAISADDLQAALGTAAIAKLQAVVAAWTA